MQILQSIAHGIDIFTEWIGRITSWLLPAMVLIGAWNVFGRFVGQAVGQNLTSNLLVELQWYLYTIVFFLGAAYTLKHSGHVRVDVLYSTWTRRTRALVNLLGTLLFLIPFSLFVIYFSWEYVMTSWAGLEQSPDPSGLPRYPIKSMILVGYGLLIVQGIAEAIKNLLIVLNRAQPEPQQEEAAQSRQEAS